MKKILFILMIIFIIFGFKEDQVLQIYSIKKLNSLLPNNEKLNYQFNNYAIDSSGNFIYYLSNNRVLYKINLNRNKISLQRNISIVFANTEFWGLLSNKKGPIIIYYDMIEKGTVKITEYNQNLQKIKDAYFKKTDSDNMTLDYLRLPNKNSDAFVGDYRNRMVYQLKYNGSNISTNTILDPFSNDAYYYSVEHDYIQISNNKNKELFYDKELLRKSYFHHILFIANKQLYIAKKDSFNSIIGKVDFNKNKIDTLIYGNFFENISSLEIRPFYNGIYWQTCDSLYIYNF